MALGSFFDNNDGRTGGNA